MSPRPSATSSPSPSSRPKPNPNPNPNPKPKPKPKPKQVAFLYFHDYHGLAPHEAGLYASLYGLMNLFARSLGGQLSDWSNERFGMRGRIWACWAVMSLEGVFCMLMASVTLSMDAPFNRKMTMVCWG